MGGGGEYLLNVKFRAFCLPLQSVLSVETDTFLSDVYSYNIKPYGYNLFI